ncbi:MAG: hypothetical protein ACJ762_12680 [Solirubrobacteraceae bacterium]
MRTISLAVLSSAVLLLGAGASSATTGCGAINGGFENTIRTANVDCATARALVRRWHVKAVKQSQGPGTKYVGDFYCPSHATDPEHVKVNCANGKKKISWFAGP